MNTVGKIIIEVITGAAVLFGLVRGGVIAQESSIIIGLITFILILSFEELKKDFHPIKNALCELQRWLGDEFNFVPMHEIRTAGYVEEHSPLALTDIGKQLLEVSGAKKAIDDNYEILEKRIKEENHQTAYDVQTGVSRLIALQDNEPYMRDIKDFVYKNPRFNKKPLDLLDVQRIMVIYLRDLFLEKHPEVTEVKENAHT